MEAWIAGIWNLEAEVVAWNQNPNPDAVNRVLEGIPRTRGTRRRLLLQAWPEQGLGPLY